MCIFVCVCEWVSERERESVCVCVLIYTGDRRYIYNAYTCVRDKKDDEVVIRIVHPHWS